MFNGSITVNRTNGELSVRCENEALNFLALNLANDIITGGKTVDEARSEFTDTVEAFDRGERPDYTQGLRFVVSPLDSGDMDTSVI